MDTRFNSIKCLHEQCERKFGISKIKVADNKLGVVADWSSPAEWDIFKGNAWKITHDHTTYSTEMGVSREWINRKGKEYIILKIVVSSTGNRTTLEHFVNEMTNMNSMVNPYNKADGLGDLYVNLLYSDSRSLIWIYRNIYFEINHEHIDKAKGAPLDTFALARWMQTYAEKHLVTNISDYYPKVAHFDISPSKVHVGDTFTIKLIMDANTNRNNYKLESDISKSLDLIDLIGQDVLTIELKALKPGTAKIIFTIIDRKTLLSSQKTVTVDVLEKGQ